MTSEDLVLIRDIVLNGGRKYTAGTIDRSRYERLVDLGWLIPVIVNKTDVVYDATDQGIAAAD
ncbi:TenA/THI-4 family protein [Tardiphaga sp. 367_B4_N1_1]|uniref:TenA/THI-4 family protein n=1 Tax=Tardiphaga sp. 367_B4_N1_1 TaxID=3240777 RepID=UPI003F24E94E